MIFYLDENVPAAVQQVLENAGHSVIWTRDLTSQGAPDDVVAAVAERDQATLVSHDKDFKKIAPRIPNGQRQRFRKLSMVRMICVKPRSAERIATAIPCIEFDYSQRAELADRRSIIEVKTDLISIWR
jgi:predicted nuclease of predicted toxin-antitoxin system